MNDSLEKVIAEMRAGDAKRFYSHTDLVGWADRLEALAKQREGWKEPSASMIHANCSAFQDCEKCPGTVETHYGPSTQICYSMAREGLIKALNTLPPPPTNGDSNGQ